MFKENDYIKLHNAQNFVSKHSSNLTYVQRYGQRPVRIVSMDNDGVIRIVRHDDDEFSFEFTITRSEQSCFRLVSQSDMDDESEYGKFKIIITYNEDGKTIEEEGVTSISIDSTSVEYKFNRKRLGFIKYMGEVKLEIKDLKQITISSHLNEKVYHIQNGVIVREHIIYDDERKFKTFKIGN